MQELDDIDKAILNRIQSNFPMTPRPYLTVADELNLTEKEILDRVSRLKKKGLSAASAEILSPENWGLSAHCVRRKCLKKKSAVLPRSSINIQG